MFFLFFFCTFLEIFFWVIQVAHTYVRTHVRSSVWVVRTGACGCASFIDFSVPVLLLSSIKYDCIKLCVQFQRARASGKFQPPWFFRRKSKGLNEGRRESYRQGVFEGKRPSLLLLLLLLPFVLRLCRHRQADVYWSHHTHTQSKTNHSSYFTLSQHQHQLPRYPYFHEKLFK